MRSSLFIVVLLTLASTTSSTASAQSPAGGPPATSGPRSTLFQLERTPAPEFTASDWAYTSLAGDAGLATLALGTVLVGSAVRDDREHSSFYFGPETWVVLGALTLAPVATTTGVYLYGEHRGHRGSYWAALGGSVLGWGTVGLIGLWHSDGLEKEVVLTLAALTLPALASTAGYYLSRDTSPRTRYVPTSGALIDLGRDGVVRLGVPNITVSTNPDAPSASLTLFGGAL